MARRLRKRARLDWETDRLQRATSGDWNAYRQLKKVGNEGWDVVFAEAHEDQEPHKVVHDHLAKIYTTGQVMPPLGAWEGTVEPFTMEELEASLARGKKGKAVGVDLTSHELLVGIAGVPGGKEALLRFYNQVYRDAAIPAEWNTALMVVIPKELMPVDPKSLRPLAMGSSVAKCYCRMLLARTIGHLRHTGPSQCSGEGRQTAEYVFTIARVMELEAEWKRGIVMAKIDLHKAYDMVDRPSLLKRLRQAMGDGPTFRSWHALLAETDAVLQTGWDNSRLQLDRGIKQGSIESPALFSYLAEQILEETRAEFKWADRPPAFEGLGMEEVLFMDDGCVWAPTAGALGRKLEEWSQVLLRAGLTLNPAKCKVYFSPHADRTRDVRVFGKVIPALSHFTIMGVPFRVGAPASELLAPFFQRAKDKFWGLKHLLRAKTPLKGRIQLLDRVIGNMVLWCLAALTPDAGGMQLLNSLQLQLVVWCMRVGKRSTETWLGFRQRAWRGARQVVWNVLGRRWSTSWLERWWCFAGHRARAGDREVPGAATVIDNYRTRQWWTLEQSKPVTERIQHPRHYPKLSNLEKDMDRASEGCSWREVARDRARWMQCKLRWVSNMDVPWTGGRQTCIRY